MGRYSAAGSPQPITTQSTVSISLTAFMSRAFVVALIEERIERLQLESLRLSEVLWVMSFLLEEGVQAAALFRQEKCGVADEALRILKQCSMAGIWVEDQLGVFQMLEHEVGVVVG